LFNILHLDIRNFLIQLKEKHKRPIGFIFKVDRHIMNHFLSSTGLIGYNSSIVCSNSIFEHKRPYKELYTQIVIRCHEIKRGCIVLCRNELDCMNCIACGLKPILLYKNSHPSFIGHYFAIKEGKLYKYKKKISIITGGIIFNSSSPF
jgi:hypothetical protein